MEGISRSAFYTSYNIQLSMSLESWMGHGHQHLPTFLHVNFDDPIVTVTATGHGHESSKFPLKNVGKLLVNVDDRDRSHV